ncbi:right-handed parallel beta-helix repeat-containing protein [Verrucomicrobium sp. BvORR034]|uniref:right-handed parallel beta-helix repeat-containing protein n=1 Tax=Verrucomicrobium sp. BvORR034 TaxID=1396418 RepID=UPI002240EC44|nr:right-handed parallel beta-helix repeat-containing protein [Verrucomicrobium sp. BvORR034]
MADEPGLRVTYCSPMQSPQLRQLTTHPVLPLGLLLSLASLTLQAAEISVKPDATGTPQLLKAALASAAEGDVLMLKPGIYRETLVIDKRITIKGGPGVILEGTVPLVADWQPAGAELPGVLTAPLSTQPAGLLLDGKFIAELRFDRAQKSGDWHWKTLLKKGPPLSGFNEIKALWIWHPKEKRAYLRLPDGISPATAQLTMVAQDKPLIAVKGAAGVVIESLELIGGATGISIGEGADRTVVRGCRIRSYEDTGIGISGTAGQCTVEQCEITRGAMEEWAPSMEHNRANYEIWRIHKDVGKYDRVGINLFRAGVGNRILNNRLDRVFDGICLGDYKAESLDDPLPDATHGQGTLIAGNVIENTRDSGIELGVGCVEVEVKDNTLRRTHGGFRFKAPRIGPVFIHHNRLIDGSPFNFWFSMDSSPAEGYIYHNTIVGRKPALALHVEKGKRDFSIPKWHVLNNLFATKEGYLDEPDKGNAVDFTSAHNVALRKDASPWPGDTTKDKGSRYGVPITLNEQETPAPDSAAVDAGMDLSTYWKGKPLPGAEKGTSKGAAPDAGAVEVR